MATSTQPYGRPTPRPRRRRRRWTGLFVVVLVLAALLVAVDRLGAWAAGYELRGRLATELTSHDVSYATLDVGMGGIPFLTQVARSEFTQITIDMTQLRLPAGGNRTADLPRLHVVATGVHANAVEAYEGTGPVTADQVTGTAVVSYQTLSEQIDLSQYEFGGVHLSDISFTEIDGTLQAQVHVEALGVSAPIQAMADVSVVDGRIQVRLRNAKAVGVPMPSAFLGPLSSLANNQLVANLPALPFGLRFEQLDVVGDGLSVTITGHDLALVGSGGTG